MLARGPRRRARPVVITLLLLAGVLAAAHTRTGAGAVMWLQRFLEFYSGVFALLALTAAVVAGVGAAQRVVPIRFRILAQAVHRATALMAVGFLVSHVLLKIMEAHATVIDAFVPFAGGHGRVLYIGLGTIAGDLLILVMVTGVTRGRFVARSRPWVWRTVHALAYAMWPLAIFHGLLAGRTPKAWVTLSYVVCFALVLLAATSRLPRLARDRRMLRARAPGPHGRTPGQAGASRRSPSAATDVPDEEFWASLRAETAGWIGDRR
ncbi:MAG: hypothetical protein JWR24_1856 [Actinoallomurus sp.]|nr:hypothetical protein [Actinoallomurus sp.]